MRVVVYKLIAILVLVVCLAAGWLWVSYQGFANEPLSVGDKELRLVVKPGMSLRGVADRLQAKGVLKHPRYLAWMARWRGVADRVKVGEYRIAPGTTPNQLLTMLVEGRVIQYSLTLVEGWTFRQVMDAVDSDSYLEHTLKGLSPDEIMTRLGHPDQHAEGRFFPDTYHFPRGTTDVAFLQRAYRAMQDHLMHEWERRAENLPYEKPYDALIMASIVEKETAMPSERADIAGVFVRRLKKGMRLQTDPTVIYGLGSKFDGNLRRRDLEHDTPYNTYMHRGLPPTPIAMPGLASIHAALHPAPGKALYFVARGDGSHQFSDTLKEHDRAVIKYQLKGHARRFSSYNGKPKKKSDDRSDTGGTEDSQASPSKP